ncbi:MAG TPA: hypothetical protein VLW84_03235 [Terriglobales bacterium]|nr:hypothetical protein [Terriglobales bacterium]
MKMLRRLAGISALATVAMLTAPACAQMAEIKEKPPQYSYASFWQIPRAQWSEMAKADAADKPIFDKALADGTIIGYGNEANLVHQPDGDTHAEWWSSMSMAGLLKVLNQLQSSGSATSPVLESATKHWDEIIVSRYYNWRSGSWQGLYTHAGFYRLKADAPDNAVDMLSKNLVAPLLEKLLADGTIVQYEIDTEAVHTDAPGRFWIFCVAANAEAIDKINAAIQDAIKSNPLGAVAFNSMVDDSGHRDYMALANASYK